MDTNALQKTGLGQAIVNASSTTKTVLSIAGTAGSMLSFYHGYKRNNGSFLWGLWWFVMGGFFWPITLTYAYSQGFAKPSKALPVGAR